MKDWLAARDFDGICRNCGALLRNGRCPREGSALAYVFLALVGLCMAGAAVYGLVELVRFLR